MSLEYRNEEENQPEVDEQSESYQRAALVFPIYSAVLIACLVVVSLAQFFIDGIGSIVFGGEKSALLAGFVKSLFVEGQYWRILTGAALHGGIIHLGFNCYALYILGKLIETLSNRAHLAMVFLLSAVGGGVLSLIFLPEGVSVGASGGIVGFLGYLTVYGYKRRKLLPESFLKNMLFNIGFIALYGISLKSYVDNWGHLGGLLAGLIYGLIQIPSDLYKDPREVAKTTELFGKIALGFFIAVCIFSVLVMLNIIKVPIPAEYLAP
jgi:membrane associated rhomboid family serine protease